MKHIILVGLGLVLMLGLIGFTSIRNNAKPIANIWIEIQDQDGDFFTDQLEVLQLLNAENTDYVLARNISDLHLKELEQRVELHPFIKEAQAFRDIKGNLKVRVIQRKPIARIIHHQRSDQYIDDEGNLLPVSERHTARVPVIELEHKMSWEKNLTETRYGQDLLDLLLYIKADYFWQAQIASVVVKREGELVLLPQVSKQDIYFGMPEDFEGKFKKLKLFYTEILPNKGWNTYTSVNLKFKNQIVCE